MSVRLLAAGAVLAVSIPGALLAQERPGLAPSGPWTIDYDADSCALRRSFGAGEDQVYLEFRRFAPGLGLQTVIASSRMEAVRPSQFSYRFGDRGEWREAAAPLTATLANDFSAVIFEPSFMPPPDEAEDPDERPSYLQSAEMKAAEIAQAAAIDTITLRRAFRRVLSLQLGKLDAPIAALQECVDELTTHWNIDVEAHKTLTRPATPIDFTDSSSMLGYPPKMARQGMPGLVNIRLDIDETGRITGCHIQMPLSDPAFEASSCADIQHAFEFEPALDKDGKPIASYWVTKVHFRMAR
jgi:hypothetical protein